MELRLVSHEELLVELEAQVPGLWRRGFRESMNEAMVLITGQREFFGPREVRPVPDRHCVRADLREVQVYEAIDTHHIAPRTKRDYADLDGSLEYYSGGLWRLRLFIIDVFGLHGPLDLEHCRS